MPWGCGRLVVMSPVSRIPTCIWSLAVHATGLFGTRRRGSPTGITSVLVIIAALLSTEAQAQGRDPGALGLRPRVHPTKPARSRVPAGYDRHRIQVKFRDDLELSLDAAGAPVEINGRGLRTRRSSEVFRQLRETGARWRQATTMNPTRLREIRSRAQVTLHREIADFSDYFILTLPPGAESEVWMDSLNALPEVELASPSPLPAPEPSVPDFEPIQGYLTAAPEGLDAHFAWTIPGGTGAGVSICDLETAWNLSHEDLPPATVLIPDGESAHGYLDYGDHGTEVLGMMLSLRNGWGTTGASYDARCFVAPVNLDSGYGLFQQILWAASQLNPGDIILIEHQTAGPYFRGDGSQFGMVPVEWDLPVYNAILAAVGNGIHVVEPAGNGGQNLDDPIYTLGNFGHAPFLPSNNSGAIMVGAGVPPTAPDRGPDRSRLDFSNFGSRLDAQGWGIRVVTTGIGDLYSDEGPNRMFTRFFGGTSSAGPNVASAIASIEGIVEQAAGMTVSPSLMRRLLTETGSPQQDGTFPATQRIGPRPDLRAAYERLGTPLVSAPSEVNAIEGDTVHIMVHAADFDGDPIDALTIDALPTGSTFATSVGNTVGRFEWPTEAGQAGSYVVTFTAGNGEQASAVTRIEVGSVERGPVITSSGGAFGLEGHAIFGAQVYAADPNGDPIVAFEASNLPSGAAFSADSTHSIGTVTWRTAFGQSGQYVITFVAESVSGKTGERQFGSGQLVVTVFNHDRAPTVAAPVSVTGTEGEALSFEVTAGDPDGDSINSLRALDLPLGAVFTAGPFNTSGTLSWTPGFDQAALYGVGFLAENSLWAMAVTTLEILDTGILAARAYVMPGAGPIRLGTSTPEACVQVEAVGGRFDPLSIVRRTVRMDSPGTGSVASISATTGDSPLPGDQDRNGTADLEFCFSKVELRRLFGNLPPGPQTIEVAIRGSLTGGDFMGTVAVDVVPQRGKGDAIITPNPARRTATLTFYTSVPAPARLRLFDVRGRMVRLVLDASIYEAGYHDVSVIGDGGAAPLPAGIYFYRLETSEGQTTGRLVILQ